VPYYSRNGADIPYKSYADVFTLMPLADIHYGNTTCDVRKLRRDLSTVDDHTIILVLGIGLNSIIVKDAKRYAKSMTLIEGDAIIDGQIDELAEIVKPVASHVMGLAMGTMRKSSYDNAGQTP